MTMSPAAFPFDRAIAELPQALDCGTVGALLTRHVLATGSQAGEVQDCRVVRLRYRPEDRCVVQYAVTIRDPRTARARRELVIGTLYAKPCRAARHARRLPGAGFIPELSMLVRMFPCDRKLPQASTLVSADDPQLRAAALSAFGPGQWSVDDWQTEVVRYREGLSLVVRYTVTATDARTQLTEQQTLYAKAYPDRDAARRTSAFLERLARFSATSRWLGGVRAPLAHLDHLGAVIFASTPGRPLSDLLETADDLELHHAIEDTARMLARFNMSDAPMMRRFSADDYLQSLRRPVAVLERACPSVAPALYRILESVCTLDEGDLRPTHRDMKPDHVLIGADGPALIDLDSCAAADPLLDPALMLARFRAIALVEERRARVRWMASNFVDQYFAIAPRAWRDRLLVCYAASLMEVAAGLFNRQVDNWRENVATLLATASEALASRDLSADAIGRLAAGYPIARGAD